MREVVKELTRPALRRGAAPETAWAFFNGGYVPLAEAKVSVLSHAFNYGTGVFEGIRAYWNAEAEQLYGLHLIEHFQRLHRSARIMKIELERSPEQLRDITVELLRRCGYREDAYVRPIAYKSSELIGVRLPSTSTTASAAASRRGGGSTTTRSRPAPRSPGRT